MGAKKSALIIPASQKWIQFGNTNLTCLVLYPTEHWRLIHRHFQLMKMRVTKITGTPRLQGKNRTWKQKSGKIKLMQSSQIIVCSLYGTVRNTMAAAISGLLTMVKTGITIVRYFGNVTASLFAVTIVRKFTPRWPKTIKTNYSYT